MDEGSACRNNRPGAHAGAHVERRTDFLRGHEHVGRDLHEEITTSCQLAMVGMSREAENSPDKENRDGSVVLRPVQIQVVLQIVQSSLCNGVPVELCNS